MNHHEPAEDERGKLEQVRCFLTNVRWQQDIEDNIETPGITWLELYILFAIHGGCEHIHKIRKEKPLSKTETLQTAITKFKARIREIVKHCTDKKHEEQPKTSYASGNRLSG